MSSHSDTLLQVSACITNHRLTFHSATHEIQENKFKITLVTPIEVLHMIVNIIVDGTCINIPNQPP